VAGTHDGFLVGTNTALFWSADVPTNLPAFTGQYSLDLSAGNAAIAISNSATSDPAYAPTFDTLITNSFSVALWAESWPATDWGAFISKDGELSPVGTNGFQLRKSFNTIRPEFVVRIGTNAFAATMPTDLASTNVWHHYVGVRNGSTGVSSLYVDSVLVASITNDFGPMGTSLIDHLVLGGRQQDGGGYNNLSQVKLFDVQMYNYTLTQSQIESLNGIIPVPSTPSPISFSVANGQLMMNWTNGVLESTTNLSTGSWIMETVSNPPVTITIPTTGNKFYRIINQ
jgi:hypothetical protein